MIRKTLFLTISAILAVFLIINLTRGVRETWQKGARIKEEQRRVDELKTQNQKLKDELEYAKSDDYLEKAAREKLNLAKPGETVVILPQEQLEKQVKAKKNIVNTNSPKWQQWLSFLMAGE